MGWVLPLSQLEPELAALLKRLHQVTLNAAVPPKTTGWQALEFLREQWRACPARVEELRRHMAAAYRYVLDDLKGEGLAPQWAAARAEVRLYGQNAWHPLTAQLVVDDVSSLLVRQFISSDKVAVSSAHLGESPDEVRRVAQALGLNILSDLIGVAEGTRVHEPGFAHNIKKLVRLLSRLKGRKALTEIRYYESLKLKIGAQGHQVGAYIHGDLLQVVTSHDSYEISIADQLVEYFQLTQQAGPASWLTAALHCLGEQEKFDAKLNILAAHFGVSLDALEEPKAPEPTWDEVLATPAPLQGAPLPQGAPPSPPDGERRSRSGALDAHEPQSPIAPAPHRPSGARPSERQGGAAHQRTARPGADQRPAADQARLLISMAPQGDQEQQQPPRARRNDLRAREAVIRYEQERGREARAADEMQPGYDVVSFDPRREHTRYIEIKGVQGLFTGEASVLLSARQYSDALKCSDAGSRDEYWLYVVENTHHESVKIYPIPWTRDKSALRYAFYAECWAPLADDPSSVSLPLTSEDEEAE